MRWPLSVVVLIALVVPSSAGADVFGDLGGDPMTVEPGPTITIVSDKEDYAPSELVTLTGSGWQPGESVAISVVDDGSGTGPWQHDATVTADGDGNVVDSFNLPETYSAVYFVTATGEFSGIATTSFTDSLSDYREGTTAVGGTLACTNPSNVLTSDNQRAHCERTTSNPGQNVVVSGFNLQSVVPPAAANIQFNVEVEGLRGNSNRAGRIALSADAGANFTATTDASNFTSATTDETKTAPGAATTCDHFGRVSGGVSTWTYGELSDASFRVRVSASGGGTGTATSSPTEFIDIDRIRVRVCYNGTNFVHAALAGRSTAVASPSGTVPVQYLANLRGTSPSPWGSTSYEIEGVPGTPPCDNHPNHTGAGTFDHFVDATAPTAHGTYDVTVRAYENDTCTGTQLVGSPITLTDGLTVGIFGDSFGNVTDSSYTENGWTDGGSDCSVERIPAAVDFDAYLQVRQGCTQTRSNISTAGLENIHLKYRWGQETNAADADGLKVEWKPSGPGTWNPVETHALINTNTVVTIPNAHDEALDSTADDSSIDIQFTGQTGAAAVKALVDDVIVTGDPIPESATVTVHKDFTDDNDDVVSIDLTECSSGTDDPAGTDSASDEDVGGTPAEFTVNDLEEDTTCTVVESPVPSGYTATYGGDCAADGTVTLDPGDAADCTVTNTLNEATFTVTKSYSDSNTDAVDVQLTCSDGDFDDTGSASPGAGNEEVFNLSGFQNGITCSVTETVPGGYTASYDGDCTDITIIAGDSPVCDITNTLNTASFTVTKAYSDSNTDAVDLTLNCSDGDFDDTGSASPGAGNEEVFTISGFDDGAMTCSVTETVPGGYTASYDGDCTDVTINVDGDYTCDITNTLNTASFTVTKAYSDSNTDAVDLTLNCSDDDFDDTGSASPGAGNEEVFNLSGFQNGMTCSVTETVPGGYTASYGDCTDVTITTGDSPQCDITNTLNTASFTVTKAYSDSNTDAVDLTLNCSDDDFDDTGSASPGAGNEEVFTISGFEDAAMTCSVTETVPSGYTASYDGDCTDVTIEVDGDYTCDITNTLNETTITVSKQYTGSAGSTPPVNVKLDCGDSDGDIDDDEQTATPGGPNAVFTITGYNVGDKCTASENPVPSGYAQDNSACIDMALGTTTSCTIKNVPALTLVTAGGCTFDRDTSRPLRQFPLIFTPDGSAAGYKLNATNPGQFFMNAAYGGAEDSVRIWIPYPFVTVGTNPVKVYSGVTTTNANKTCFAPSNLVRSQTEKITWQWSGVGANTWVNKKYIDVTVPAGSPPFVYARVHLDYGLKGMAANCTKGTSSPTATCSSPSTGFTIAPYRTYPFSFTDGLITPTDTIEHYNEFKKNPGIGGLVTQTGTGTPVAGASVKIYQGTTATGTPAATLTTDADGWYMWSYKYTGKATSFTVKVQVPPSYTALQTVPLKSNGYLTVNFNNVP